MSKQSKKCIKGKKIGNSSQSSKKEEEDIETIIKFLTPENVFYVEKIHSNFSTKHKTSIKNKIKQSKHSQYEEIIFVVEQSNHYVLGRFVSKQNICFIYNSKYGYLQEQIINQTIQFLLLLSTENIPINVVNNIIQMTNEDSLSYIYFYIFCLYYLKDENLINSDFVKINQFRSMLKKLIKKRQTTENKLIGLKSSQIIEIETNTENVINNTNSNEINDEIKEKPNELPPTSNSNQNQNNENNGLKQGDIIVSGKNKENIFVVEKSPEIGNYMELTSKPTTNTTIYFEKIIGNSLEDKLCYLFFYYFDNNILNRIIKNININASLHYYLHNMISKKKDRRYWKTLTIEEYVKFLIIVIYLGINKQAKENKKYLWSKNCALSDTLNKYMNKSRYYSLFRIRRCKRRK